MLHKSVIVYFSLTPIFLISNGLTFLKPHAKKLSLPFFRNPNAISNSVGLLNLIYLHRIGTRIYVHISYTPAPSHQILFYTNTVYHNKTVLTLPATGSDECLNAEFSNLYSCVIVTQMLKFLNTSS